MLWGEKVAVFVGVTVFVGVAVLVGRFVAVGSGVCVNVGVAVTVGVWVATAVLVGTAVGDEVMVGDWVGTVVDVGGTAVGSVGITLNAFATTGKKDDSSKYGVGVSIVVAVVEYAAVGIISKNRKLKQAEVINPTRVCIYLLLSKYDVCDVTDKEIVCQLSFVINFADKLHTLVQMAENVLILGYGRYASPLVSLRFDYLVLPLHLPAL